MLGGAIRHVICGFYLFIFPPCYVVVWVSKTPHRRAGESVSWCLETCPLLRLPSRDRSLSLPLLSLFISFMFCPTSFLIQWAAFLGAWCALAAFRNCFLEFAQHSMFFRWICEEKVVFLFYSSTTLGPPLRRELWILPPQQALFPFCFRPRLQMELDWMLMCLFVFKSFPLQSSLLPFQYCPIDISFSE